MARHKMTNRRKDKQTFAHTAGATQSLNLRAKPMRGGFRIQYLTSMSDFDMLCIKESDIDCFTCFGLDYFLAQYFDLFVGPFCMWL